MKWISRIAGFAGFAGFLLAQPNSSQFNVIPKADNTPGYVKFWGQKMNVPGFSVTLTPPAGLTADYTLTLPDTPMDGFIYYDSMTGLLSFTGAGTCGVDCMTLTTAQNASGIKTFTNGIIMQGTSTVETLQMGASFALTIGTDQVELNSAALIIENGTAGQSRVALGGFDGVGPVVSYGGRLRLYMIDGVTTKAGIGHLDNSKWESFNGYTVGGTTIVDGSRNATFVGLTIPTGAANGLCWTSDAAGIGSWQTCGGGGSFVTTGTNQTGLTGTKEWNDIHTHNANLFTRGIIPNADNTYPIGTGSFRFSEIRLASEYVGNTAGTRLESLIIASSITSSWLDSTGNANVFIDAGAPGIVRVNNTGAFAAEMSSTTGFDTSIGYLSSGVTVIDNASNATFATMDSPTITGTSISLTGFGPGINIDRFGTGISLLSGSFLMSTGSGVNTKIFMSWFTSAGGSIQTFSNANVEQNSLSQNGVSTTVGYSVGPMSSPTMLIDSAGHATFTTLRITTSPSVGYLLTSDALGNATWQAPAGGSFVTTNTNQTGLSGTKAWSNLHTFNGGVAIKLDSTARNWLPESASAYTLGDGVSRWLAAHVNTYNAYSGYYMGALMELESDHLDFYNTTPLPRVSLGGFDGVGPVVNYGGRIRLYKIDGVTVKAGIGHLDTDRFESINGFSVAGVAAIDGARNANLNNLTVNSAITSFGVAVLSGGLVTSSISATAVSVTALTINSGASVGNCWTATSTAGAGSWQTCGGAISNYVTTNTNQLSGLTGDKSWSGSHTFGATLNTAAITPIANITYSLGTSSRYWSDFYTQKGRVGSGTSNVLDTYSGSVMTSTWTDVAGNTGVLIYAGNNSPSNKSVVRVNDSGAFIAEMTGEDGFDTSLPYRANGVSGISSTLTVRNAAGSGSCTITVSFGIVTASTC